MKKGTLSKSHPYKSLPSAKEGILIMSAMQTARQYTGLVTSSARKARESVDMTLTKR